MTVGVAILNKNGVALATDSAVTVSSPQAGKEKIYNSANKLFTLSKYRPVGIMIYGDAEIMDIPWETIIKFYRSKLGKKDFETLQEYAEDFLDFLNGNTQLFSESAQSDRLNLYVYMYLLRLKKQYRDEIDNIISEQEGIKEEDARALLDKIINEKRVDLLGQQQLPGIPDTNKDDFAGKHRDEVQAIAKEVFEDFPLTDETIDQLVEISGYMFSRDFFPFNSSGIVIAGFGESELFPSLYEYHIEGVVDNRLKYIPRRSHNMTSELSVVIYPFAQAEMVATFMEGVDPDYREASDSYLSTVFENYPLLIAERIAPLVTEADAQALKAALQETSQSLLKQYLDTMVEYQREHNIVPILGAVAFLPKDELASMAEALVNLTSVKRHVSMDVESVGGPIDVAIISKGDGFIWMKRKHYFKAELNPTFFENYFREESHDDTQQE